MSIRKKTIKALNDPFLTGALESFSESYYHDRSSAFAEKDFDSLRDEIDRIKTESIERMDYLWEEFRTCAESAGAKVHFASDAVSANQIVLKILDANDAARVVKSKSMLTEEIELNKTLEAYGITVIETDLGEWILQLDHDRPSHIVMPAIHKTSAEVESVFKKLSPGFEGGIDEMVKFARGKLREEFLSADAGITGANLAIASNGSIVLVTNEGNGRMVTCEPAIHIAIVGLEKIVPDTASALKILESLPPSATGQKISSYVSFISGPTQKEMHVVVVDNGRRKMASDPAFAEALKCIKCGSCLNRCPIYLSVGGHTFGHVYMGGIGSILTAFQNGIRASSEVQALCTGCGECVAECPAGIDIPGMIANLRTELHDRELTPVAKRSALRYVLSDRKRFHSLLKIASKIQGPFTSDGFVRHLPLKLAGIQTERKLPVLASKPLRETHPVINPAKGKKLMRVGLFSGCLIDFVYPEIGAKMIDILTHFGCEVLLPDAQTCCGIPAICEGDRELAAEMAKENMQAFTDQDVEAIITGCATCTHTLKVYSEPLPSTYGISDFLVERLRIDNLKTATRESITYHDSCHLKRKLEKPEAPRKLLESIGHEISEMEHPDRCCGFAGSYSVQFPELSTHLGRKKIKLAEATGANFIAMDCPGCLLQYRGYDSALNPLHTIELLWKTLFPEDD